MIEDFNAGFKPYADKALAEMPEAKMDRAAKAFNRYRENVLKDLITPEVKQAVRNALLKNAREIYTQEEIDGMIAFTVRLSVSPSLPKSALNQEIDE